MSTSSLPPLWYPLTSPKLGRRSFLGASVSMAGALMAARVLGQGGPLSERLAWESYPFSLGVASGDPSADGFVIWTRLAPKPLEGGGMPAVVVSVDWQVAEDEGMTRVVARGKAVASPDWAHSVHVEVSGLKPDRWYWYRFRAGGEISPLGRGRTLAARDRAAGECSALKIAFASCQHWESGYYNAYDHMNEDAPDLVLHLGDYIYEGAAKEGLVRKHNSREILTLEDYRNRHALYKTDLSLQAMHAAAPFVVTWDDHEFDNNCAGDISEEKQVKREDFLMRRAAAYQAYYEHMPLRAACLPKGPGMKLYRSVRHGRLVDFHVLDTRQHRTDQPHGDGLKRPGKQAMDPKATLLGPMQKKWLMRELSSAQAEWNVLAQQVMMARVDRAAGEEVLCSMDQWPGYEVERREVLEAMGRLKVPNPVVLTGDIHSHWANELGADPERREEKPAAAEFVCTSISSKGDGRDGIKAFRHLSSENPFVKYFSDHRGYGMAKIGADRWETAFRNVPVVSRKEDSRVETGAVFVLEAGSSELQRQA